MTPLDLGHWQIAVLLLSTLLSSELLLRFPLRTYVQHLRKLLQRIVKTLRSSRISDHWKEQVMLVYASKLLRYSLVLPVLLLLALAPLGLGLWTATDSTQALIDLSLDALFLASVTFVSVLYLLVRARLHA
jgi:hypothetical protein